MAFLAAVALYDRLTDRPPTYEPVSGTTALDTGDLPWETAPDPRPASCGGLPAKWLVIDWDAAEWDILLPLLERGEMPHLEALLRRASYGSLATFLPTISPAIWTTIATGVPPDQHGIRHFYNQRPRLARWWNRIVNLGRLERRLYSNAHRRAPAIWNLLSERDEPVMVVGYHNTFPVEEVEGLMVSNYLAQDSVSTLLDMKKGELGDDADLSSSLVYPPEKLADVLEIHQRLMDELPRAVRDFVAIDDEDELRDFLRKAQHLDPEGDQRPYFLTRAWLYDQVAAEVAETFYERLDPTLAIVHFQSLDWAAHHFLYFDRPEGFEKFGWDEATYARLDSQIPLYEDTVVAFHRYADEWLGRLVALTDESTGILIVSDHGTGPGPDPDLPGFHDDAPPGVIVLSGPGIRSGHRVEGATIYDVLPTLMASLDAPVAKDLPGRVLQEVFCPTAWAPQDQISIASYREGEAFAPPISAPTLRQDVARELESLGYLD